ncbi:MULTISPECIES: alpha/beta hydrolase [Nocardiaceae]|uniref:Acetyl esterase/lipase n=1 Tax=Rhodococcoides corynebacterioides TaxID=53972 RepID=A0ABS2KVA5_9NOCA|nr:MULTISPECIES: alpha/beta hydrolase [Rhodococcus]MBM7415746.1 acetyl esterase/lipase [Rhodococcus corynebacterioides]MBP1118208.1 acetyl esterase/lipase [Rhodococcus sp. PvP016]
MISTRPIPERGSLRSRAAARATQSTLRPVASRLPFGRGGERVARVLVEVAMRACGGVAPGTVVRTVREDGVVGEWVEGGDASVDTAGPILYLHGSAYAICSARTHRGLASRLSRATQRPVFVVDYRLAPEFPFPAAADDVERAYRWLLASGHAPESVVVAGDSAGGHLALDLVLDNARRSAPQPSAVLLFSPLIDLTFTLAQNRERERRDPMISAAAARALTSLYTRGEDPDGPRLRLAVEAGTALPHFLVQAGGAEMLVADAEHLQDLVVDAGGTCTLEIWPDQMHVFQALPRISPEADRALARAAHALTALHRTETRH